MFVIYNLGNTKMSLHTSSPCADFQALGRENSSANLRSIY